MVGASVLRALPWLSRDASVPGGVPCGLTDETVHRQVLFTLEGPRYGPRPWPVQAVCTDVPPAGFHPRLPHFEVVTVAVVPGHGPLRA